MNGVVEGEGKRAPVGGPAAGDEVPALAASSAPAPSASPSPSPSLAPASSPPCERRGRPRSAAADTAIIEAVLHLIEEGAAIAELSMERIARVAGVGKATLYRRWPGKDALMLDVMRSLEADLPTPSGKSVRDDLVALLEALRRSGLAKRDSALLRTVLSHVKGSPALWREYHDAVVRRRREVLHAVLRRGMATGEVRADRDVEVLGDLFVGPMLVRAMFQEWRELPEGLAEEIVDTVLGGVRPRGSGAD
ncbi:TetR/AcrR family transcriptional regulator [Streptomyces sp. NPDC003077]|uniref:TetR/AcrR family transcriptional regulator n=1 Tax=Streptomyces sp. NPDC003077 TaxID=3154443 RepID=UPI0033A34C44